MNVQNKHFCSLQIEHIVKGNFMGPTFWKAWLVAGMAATAIALPAAGSAQSLDQILQGQQARTRLAQESQERVDNVLKQTRSLEDQFKVTLKEIDGLKVYNTLLGLQVDNQNLKMKQLRESIDQVEVINRQIVPIMMQMIEGLEQFVEFDVPFLLEERRDRVLLLQELMERDDVTVAEKFRVVTEAYQIEQDYGTTIESYKDTIQVDDRTMQVDFLRIGRVALMYQSEDGQVSGAWDQANGQWQVLGNEYKNQIRKALKIATKQMAPELIILPVSAPEAG